MSYWPHLYIDFGTVPLLDHAITNNAPLERKRIPFVSRKQLRFPTPTTSSDDEEDVLLERASQRIRPPVSREAPVEPTDRPRTVIDVIDLTLESDADSDVEDPAILDNTTTDDSTTTDDDTSDTASASSNDSASSGGSNDSASSGGSVSSIEAEVDGNEGDSGDRTLTSEQERVWKWVIEEQKNVFFTGPAGTGKSHLLRRLVSELQRREGKNAVAVTAPTGIAARTIQGQTVHSWGGISWGAHDADLHYGRVQRNSAALSRWKKTKWLIVDEVSMVSASLWDLLEELGRRLRHSAEPFGGIKLVVTGDPLQLPPVAGRWFFQSKSWAACMKHVILFTKIMRQRNPAFRAALNDIRIGNVTRKTSDYIYDVLGEEPPWLGHEACIELFPTRAEVSQTSQRFLQRQRGQAWISPAEDLVTKGANRRTMRSLLHDIAGPDKLVLKTGVRVMYLRNDRTLGLVNGSLGTVVCFTNHGDFVRNKTRGMMNKPWDPSAHPVVKWEMANGKTMLIFMERQTWKAYDASGNSILRKQYAMVHADFLTIHKAQGLELDYVIIHLENVKHRGAVYSALSRGKTPERTYVTGWDPSKVKTDQRAMIYLATARRASRS